MNIKSRVERRRLQQFQEALTTMPRRGEGLHCATLSVANKAKRAGLSKDAAIEAISALDRDFKPNEVVEAVEKAYANADGSSMLRRTRKMPAPVKKAAKAGKLLLDDAERTARLQAALIEAGGGGEVDPFGPELYAESNPPPDLIPAIPGMEGSECLGGLFTFLRTAFQYGDKIYIGTGREGKHRQLCHIKTREKWLEHFSTILDRVKNASSLAEKKQILIATGFEYPLFCINPVTSEPDERNSLRSDGCVSEYRHILLESDQLPLGQQVALIRGLKLPVVSLTFSGGKSLHALVRADALGFGSIKDKSDWDQKIKLGLYSQMAPLGFDRANSNPSRFSRLPGIWRPDKDAFQRLLYLNNTLGDSNVHA
jgi:hypothetical protein